MKRDLNRFIQAHADDYATALAQIRAGKKQSHWMWYIFPQLKELGNSRVASHYGIQDLEEATRFVRHPFLGKNLVRISKVLAELEGKTASEIFGCPDKMKLRSCLTLFSQVSETSPLFEKLIRKFFGGSPDQRTLQLLEM